MRSATFASSTAGAPDDACAVSADACGVVGLPPPPRAKPPTAMPSTATRPIVPIATRFHGFAPAGAAAAAACAFAVFGVFATVAIGAARFASGRMSSCALGVTDAYSASKSSRSGSSTTASRVSSGSGAGATATGGSRRAGGVAGPPGTTAGGSDGLLRAEPWRPTGSVRVRYVRSRDAAWACAQPRISAGAAARYSLTARWSSSTSSGEALGGSPSWASSSFSTVSTPVEGRVRPLIDGLPGDARDPGRAAGAGSSWIPHMRRGGPRHDT